VSTISLKLKSLWFLWKASESR